MSRNQSTVFKHLPETIRFVETLKNESSVMLIRHGETRQNAMDLSTDFVVDVCQQITGLVYFGKNTRLDAESKSILIREDYNNGKSIKQLAQSYSLSERQIYNILFYQKEKSAAKASTTCGPLIAVAATRMFMKAAIPKDDAIEATRGLLTMLATKFGGAAFYTPSVRRIRFILRDIDIFKMHKAGKSIGKLATFFNLSQNEIETVIEQFPVTNTATVNLSEFPRIRNYVLDVAASFKEINPDVHDLLESATENITRAEEIIKKLEGEY